MRELSSFRHVDEEHGSEISPLVFMREYVSQNRPFVLRGGAKHWPALKRWTLPYLVSDFSVQSVFLLTVMDYVFPGILCSLFTLCFGSLCVC